MKDDILVKIKQLEANSHELVNFRQLPQNAKKDEIISAIKADQDWEIEHSIEVGKCSTVSFIF